MAARPVIGLIGVVVGAVAAIAGIAPANMGTGASINTVRAIDPIAWSIVVVVIVVGGGKSESAETEIDT